MACQYTYQGKTYESWEFAELLTGMPAADLMQFMPAEARLQMVMPSIASAAAGFSPSALRGHIERSSPKLATLIHDVFTSQKTFNWWHRNLGSQFHKAQINKFFRRVFETTQSYEQDTARFASEAAELAPDLIPKMDTMKDGDICKLAEELLCVETSMESFINSREFDTNPPSFKEYHSYYPRQERGCRYI